MKIILVKTEAVIKYCLIQLTILYPDQQTDWSCSFWNKISNKLACFCVQKYSCNETEQFHLEADLVDIDEYLNKTNSFYKEKCEHGLNKLTNETSWTCDLQYDKIDEREFYCECKRDIMCQRHKVLKFQSHIRLVKE